MAPRCSLSTAANMALCAAACWTGATAAHDAPAGARGREVEATRQDGAERRPRGHRHEPSARPDRPDPMPKPYPYVRAVPNTVPAATPSPGYPPLVITRPAHRPTVIFLPPAETPPVSQGPPFLAGYALPEAYRHPLYHLHDWQNHPQLYPPPAGYQWVRIGVEVLLVSPTTGFIALRLVF